MVATGNAPAETTAGNAPQGAPNGVLNAPTPGAVARSRVESRREAARAAFIAGGVNAPAPAPANESAAEPEATEPQTPESPVAPAAPAAPARPDPTTETEAPDQDTQRRIGAVQAAEERSRKKLAAERAEIEREWAPKVKAAQDFEALRAKAARARSNPAHLVDVLKALGYEETHFEPMAQALYSLTEAGKADPTRRSQAERMLRERESLDEISELRRQVDDLKSGLTRRDEQNEFRAMQTQYLDAAKAGIKADSAPTVHLVAQKNPGKLQEALWRHTVELTKEHGDVPAIADVIARYQAELDDLGIPRPTSAAPNPTKQNNQTADKTNPAKTLSPDLGAPRVPPRSALNGDEHRQETRRMLEAGKLDIG